MLKLINPAQHVQNERVTSLVPVTSYGIDRGWLQKQASGERAARFRDIKPTSKDHALIHVIAMGAGEATGANRNADYWPETSKKIELVDPDAKEITRGDGRKLKKTSENWTDKIDRGLIETHATFLKGAVYRDHKNQPKKGDKKHGDTRAAVYDKDMRRVELLVEVPKKDKDWVKDIDALDAGKDIPWSMASNVKHDVCNCCGNKAKTRAEYCEHLIDNLGQLLKSGHVVCAINEDPNFFDISRVGRPADRIAYSLRKLASDGIDDPDAIRGISVPLGVLAESQPMKIASRLAVLDKLADIEKRIDGLALAKTSILAGKKRAGSEKSAAFAAYYGRHDQLPELMAAFKLANVIIPLEQFASFVLEEEAPALSGQIKAAAIGMCSRLMAEDALALAIHDTYSAASGLLYGAHQKLARDLSADWGTSFEDIRGQVISATLAGETAILSDGLSKSATYVSPVADQVAREYASYLMTAISEQTKQGSAEQELACEVIAAQLRA